MNRRKEIKLIIGVCAILIIIVCGYCCKVKAPAPAGIHGEYSLATTAIYQTNKMNKDSILAIFANNNLTVKTGRLHDYDAPWDSLRYLIGNIQCDTQRIEAYLEFKDKKAVNTTFKILWFNATPTKNNRIYETLTKRYYECFDNFLKTHHMIK